MKNPVTYSVSDANNLKKKRQRRYILLISGVLSVLLVSLLVLYVLRGQREIDVVYPSSETTGMDATSPDSSSSPTARPSESSASTGDAGGTPHTDASVSEGGVQTQPEGEESNRYIPENTFLQEIPYQERDSLYHTLQTDIETFIRSSEKSRVAVYYLNLKNMQNFGFEHRNPFVPAGLMNFPICFDLFLRIEEGSVSLSQELSVTEEDLVNGSTVFTAENIGETFPLRALVNNAMTAGDNASTNAILRTLGGIDVVNDRLKTISNLVDFRADVRYTDFDEVKQSGKGRTSCQDLAMYVQTFYQKYLQNPDIYQPLFNDLTSAHSDWGAASAVPNKWLKGEKTGVNSDFHAYGSLALVFAEEPYLLCIMSENEDEDIGKNLHGEIGRLIYQYIHACYRSE